MHMFSITFPHCICMKMIRSLWYYTLWIFVSLGFNLVDHIAWTQLSFPISFLFFWSASIHNNLLTYIIRKDPYEKKKENTCMYQHAFIAINHFFPQVTIYLWDSSVPLWRFAQEFLTQVQGFASEINGSVIHVTQRTYEAMLGETIS